ncbi:hypothetical protein ACTNCI_10850 [Mitsuokella jalaludinii]|uniref:hypothetical protein n=1 Tax=Mitsuokella jalaludinii TaxID=187979 RepID=UPI003F8C5CFA
MHKDRPELRADIAQTAIQEIYSRRESKALEELRNDCLNYQCTSRFPSATFRKFWGKVMMHHATNVLTAAALASMPEKMQEFIYLRYYKNEQLMAIHHKIDISVAQLSNWNKKMLLDIADYAVDFHLQERDVFNRLKVLNLVETMTMLLEFFDQMDPDREIAASCWVDAMSYRRDQYRKILSAIDEILWKGKDGGMHSYLVSEKICHPNDTDIGLARACYVDKGVISRHLRLFIDSLREPLAS